MNKVNDLINKLKESFSNPEIKKQVLDEVWCEKNLDSGLSSTGFCYYASEVLYRLTGKKDKWFICCISKKDWEFGPHYFLIDKESNEIVDITVEQFGENNIPYGKAKKLGFRNISKKARLLAKHIGYDFFV